MDNSNNLRAGPGDGGHTIKPPPITQYQLDKWMEVFVRYKPEAIDWPLTKLCYPGTHDSATYGPSEFPWSVARFNWQCQDANIYEQAMMGIRCFDLRLKKEKVGPGGWLEQYYPYHGGAMKTGDPFSGYFQGNIGSSDTIASQLKRFVTTHPTELIIIHLTLQDIDAAPVHAVLGDHVMLINDDSSSPMYHKIPTIRDMLDTKRNILVIGTKQYRQGFYPPDDFYYTWTDSVYNENDWKSNDPKKVKTAIEKWMNDNSTVITNRSLFWNAQCQLTPSMNSFADWVKGIVDDGVSTSPRKLSQIMNPFVRSDLTQDTKWRKAVSIMSVDFPEPLLILSIVMINFLRD